MNHQIDLSCSTSSTIVIEDSIAAGLACFSDVWHNFFRNALNLGFGGDPTEHVIWRVDNLSFPASIKYVIIHRCYWSFPQKPKISVFLSNS